MLKNQTFLKCLNEKFIESKTLVKEIWKMVWFWTLVF